MQKKTKQKKYEFIKSNINLQITNFDILFNDTDHKFKRHGYLFPYNIRAVFCGPSECGKTNAVISMIVEPNGLRFDAVYVFSKSLNQPKFVRLKEIIKPMKEIKYFEFSENDEVIPPEKALPYSIMFFDDVQLEKQNNIKAYYTKGRHNTVDSFYTCQSYAAISKHFVRDNFNFLGIFRQDDTNLKHIYNDHVNTDMSFNEFKNLCAKCWDHNKYSFLLIDKESEINKGRYRRNIDNFIREKKSIRIN